MRTPRHERDLATTNDNHGDLVAFVGKRENAMKKLNPIAILIAATALLAGAALALDFDPILDADYIGYPDGDTAFAGHLAALPAGPLSDAEWDGPLGEAGMTSVLVAATFDPILDADFLDTSGYVARSDAVAMAACPDPCNMNCGADCTSHCGDTCGTQ